jgi:hypothetical protein
VVQRKLGRAGGVHERTARQRAWDRRYGEGNWEVGYVLDGQFVPQDQALESVYYRSYEEHFAAHPEDLEELVRTARCLRNPHAEATTGVELQVPAILTYLERHGRTLRGKEVVDIGSWEGRASHSISIRLSPLTIRATGAPKRTWEQFWQQKKCLAVWDEGGTIVARPEALYRYVGPEAIRSRSGSALCGTPIESRGALRAWLAGRHPPESVGLIAATFVIDPEGRLRLADRHSEHVACAGDGPVRSAGEMFFSTTGEAVVVEEVSNLSTGYCPEPESWQAVGEALDCLGVGHPGGFTTAVIFRRCPECGQRNVVKDGWFVCQVCGAELPQVWNFSHP